MEFFAPVRSGEGEINEKRSRFIGRIFPVSTEEEAKLVIDRVKTECRGARHTPWCYLLPDGTSRSSDDGEPSGTSGAPMLEMLKRENIRGAAVVVSRYFGGVLLGPGGLIRAYTAAAKSAVENSGLALFATKTRVTTVAPYSIAAKIKHEAAACGGVEESCEYAENVTINALFDTDDARKFCNNIIEITAGAVIPEISGEALVPAEK
ncbi:MAG: DUF1949 domain-containing protein [Clostridiales bacterium]|nr:DUF1949 domain-containing protein [Clostridiales bacterium]